MSENNQAEPIEQIALDLGDTTTTSARSSATRTTPGTPKKQQKKGAAGPDAGIVEAARALFEQLQDLDLDTRIETINALRLAIHDHSPFKDEPVDLVLWVRQESVQANDYNPNVVAPPQKRTLTASIKKSGFTQPIVSWPTGPGEFEVVDGFHRNLVSRETPALRKRLHHRLPITVIRSDRRDRAARIETTIVHNEARGRHTIRGEEDVVLELSRLGKTDAQIAEDLGMDPDKVLRLKQEAGLATVYADEEFSEAFEVATNDPFALPDLDPPDDE